MAGEIQLNGTTALTESGGVVTLNNVDSATNRTNLGLGTAATTAASAYATAAQGTLADTATQPGDNATTLNVSATDKLLGRSTAGAGAVEEITLTSAGRALLDDVDAAAQRTTLGLGTAATSASTDFVSSSRTITAGTGLSGGGDLSTNRTINVSFSANESNVKTAINASGSAPIYACRAWINFDGTSASIGTGRANGNVSGVTDNGTGDYTVTFATAMPDNDYVVAACGRHYNGVSDHGMIVCIQTSDGDVNVGTSSVRITTHQPNSTLQDSPIVSVAIFR